MKDCIGQYIPADPNETVYSTGHYETRETDYAGRNLIMVESPVLGPYPIEHPVIVDLFRTPIMRRAARISQLSKSEQHATIPNTAGFVRRPHILDIYQLSRHFAAMTGTSDEVVFYMANQGMDDAAHGPFSHATDIAVEQIWDGAEEFHEEQWVEAKVIGGIVDVLKQHGVQLGADNKVPNVKIPLWFESPSPHLNVDRLQYTVAELLLWFDHDGSTVEVRELVRELTNLDNFAIADEGYLAFKDLDVARLFSKGYLLLTTEHWNDPINRVQLYLLIEASKRAVAQRRLRDMYAYDQGQTRRFTDYMYVSDDYILEAMKTGPDNQDDVMYSIKNLLNPIAHQERERWRDYKARAYGAFLLDRAAEDYPNELLEPKRVDFGPPSSQVHISPMLEEEGAGNTTTETAGGGKLPVLKIRADGLVYELPPLKNRSIDPLVISSDGRSAEHLSQLDGAYAKLLVQQQQVRRTRIVVDFAITNPYAQIFKEGVAQNAIAFESMKENQRMAVDHRRRLLEAAATWAVEATVQRGTLRRVA